MKTSKLVSTALVAAVSLGVYALESAIPPLVAIPGVKLGLANAITLISLYTLGSTYTLWALVIRIIISSLLFAHPVSFLFSISGGLTAFAAMSALKRFFDHDSVWALSVFGAFAHNIGQIVVAIIITKQLAIAYYFLILVISSVVCGVFTGICAMYCIKKLNRYGLNMQ